MSEVHDRRQATVRAIGALARRMLDGSENDFIVGSREIVRLAGFADITMDGPLAAIRAFEAETDDYPIGDVRNLYSEELLARLDNSVQSYIERSWSGLTQACAEIARIFGADPN